MIHDTSKVIQPQGLSSAVAETVIHRNVCDPLRLRPVLLCWPFAIPMAPGKRLRHVKTGAHNMQPPTPQNGSGNLMMMEGKSWLMVGEVMVK